MKNRLFSHLGLADPIRRALDAKNYVHPTPIQAQAIPQLIQGRDMLGIAQTGTGKTAAFALPILHRLSAAGATSGSRSERRHPRALILAPTRELAIQIGEEIQAYGRYLDLRHTVIFGGVGQRPQVAALQRGADIVVATPGRLIDLMNQGRLSLDRIQTLVLDEADRMLDMGFVRDVRRIVAALPKRRQSMLFSATMAAEITRLADQILDDPVRVEVTPRATPVELIEQTVYHVQTPDKAALLAQILKDPALSRVIVFSRTKHRANRVVERLAKNGTNAEAIHGNKSQAARQRALAGFREGKVRVLVATDIAARGIDVDGVTHVINFELPNEAESYVHRIGRTARAGAQGIALSFCDTSERAYLREIEKLIGRRISLAEGSPAGQAQQAPANAKGPRADAGAKRARHQRSRNRRRGSKRAASLRPAA